MSRMSVFKNSVPGLPEPSIHDFKTKTGFTLLNIEPEGMSLWKLKQFDLSVKIFDRVFDIIGESNYKKSQKDDLKNTLVYLFKKALPFFVDGMDKNPVHHNVQVVENMLIIAIEETKSDRLDQSYKFVRKAAVLALLHDIGSGVVNPDLRKIKSSDIKNREQELFKGRMPKEEIEKEIGVLIGKAVEYRMLHMKEGAKIAENLLNEFNRHQKKLKGVTFDERDIQDIKKCIEIHDLPSIAGYQATLGKPCNRNYLIQLDNPLAIILREADRLWMVSKEGLDKDLFDDLEKNKKPHPLLKLQHNVKRFKEEYLLYKFSGDFRPDELNGFKEETLFRTNPGFKLLKQYLWQRIDELNFKYDGKNTNIIEFVLKLRCR